MFPEYVVVFHSVYQIADIITDDNRFPDEQVQVFCEAITISNPYAIDEQPECIAIMSEKLRTHCRWVWGRSIYHTARREAETYVNTRTAAVYRRLL